MPRRKSSGKKNPPQQPIEWVPQHVLDGWTPSKSAAEPTDPLRLGDIWFEAYQGYVGWDVVQVFDFEFAYEFWQGVNWTPRVSELLSSATSPRTVQAHPIGNIKSIFTFRSYELTQREPTVSEMGAPGMAVVYRYEVSDLTAENLNHEWEEIRLGAIGESINKDSRALQGVRLLDRTKQKKVSHRFEMWCKEEAQDVRAYAEKRAELLRGRFTVVTVDPPPVAPVVTL